MTTQKRGLFVSFEGGEGVGKTTQIALLRSALERDGRQVRVTREPGGDAVGETVRNLLLTSDMTPRAELLLFLASRAQNVEQVIRPHLANGDVVLCDRFIDSSVAYQGMARSLGMETVAHLNRFATGSLVPDLTLLLDIEPSLGLARQTNRNRMEDESLAFHHLARQGFLAAAANEPARITVLDAALPLEVLHAQIYALVRRHLDTY
jgi:dTMP kinase